MAFFHGFNARQKMATVGLAVASVTGLCAVGSQYVNHSTEKPHASAPTTSAAVQTHTDGRGWTSSKTSSVKTKYRPAYASVNINTANEEELDTLPGIGPAMARRIIEYRTQHNGFQSIDELDQVKGIGPKKLVNIKPYCRL